MRFTALLLLTIPSVLSFASYQKCIRVPISAPVAIIDTKQAKCLATMVYGEARGETTNGKIAVAYSAINRQKRSPNKGLCDIVLAPKQYSIFNGNSKLQKIATSFDIEPVQKNAQEELAWEESLQVAKAVLRKKYQDPTNGATHYISWKLMRQKGYKTPKWSQQYKTVGVIDSHTFYVPFYPTKQTKKAST